MTWIGSKDSLDLAVIGRNLVNRHYYSFGDDLGSLEWANDTFAALHTFSLQLTYSFTAS